MIQWLKGKKTYIVAIVCLVYGVLALTKVAPDPNHIGVWTVQIAAYAVGFRAALQKLIDIFESLQNTKARTIQKA